MEREELLIILRSQRIENQESSSTLRVADVVELLLSSCLKNVVNEGRQVEVADLIPAEPPEVLESTVGIDGSMVAGVVVAAGVAQPYVVTGFSQQVRCKERHNLSNMLKESIPPLNNYT